MQDPYSAQESYKQEQAILKYEIYMLLKIEEMAPFINSLMTEV